MPTFVLIGQTIADMVPFFDFSRWQPSAILDFYVCLYHPRRVFGGLYDCAKFVWNLRSNVGTVANDAESVKRLKYLALLPMYEFVPVATEVLGALRNLAVDLHGPCIYRGFVFLIHSCINKNETILHLEYIYSIFPITVFNTKCDIQLPNLLLHSLLFAECAKPLSFRSFSSTHI